MLFNSTKKHEAYWKNRIIDWKTSYTSTVDHPHRALIIEELEKMNFGNLLELGCASGPNLIRILRAFPGVRLSGIDISSDAIAEARNSLPETSVLSVGPMDQLPFETKSVDVVLTDMALIYISRDKIGTVVSEIRRVCRKHVIFVEFHSTSALMRLALQVGFRYNGYDFRKLLKKNGFQDISVRRIPWDAWPGGKPQKLFGNIITARV